MPWLQQIKKKLTNRFSKKKVTGVIERKEIVAMLAEYFGEEW